MQRIKFNTLLQTVLDVCHETVDGIENVADKMKLVMKVISLVLLKDELELEGETGARGLAEKLLADDVMARINPESVLSE